MRLFFWTVAALGLAAPLFAQDDLPKRTPGQTLDFEPKLMLETPGLATAPQPPLSPEEEEARLEGELAKARERAVQGDQLFKEGILAKVEVEGRVLRVVRLEKQLADAQLAVAAARKEAAVKAGRRPGDEEAARAESAWEAARETAQAASAKWSEAKVGAAALDLKRKRQLFAEGAGSRREVQAAEDRLALLSGTAPKPPGP